MLVKTPLQAFCSGQASYWGFILVKRRVVHLQVGMKLQRLLRVHGCLLLGGCDAGNEGLLVDAVLRGRLAAADALRDELAVHLGVMQAA